MAGHTTETTMKPTTPTKIGAPFVDNQGPKFLDDPEHLAALEKCLLTANDGEAMRDFAQLRKRFLGGDWLAGENTPRVVSGEEVVLEDDLPQDQVRRSAGAGR